MADKECRPSRISRNRSGSTTNPDHNMLWSMRTRRPPSSLCSRSAAIPSAEPAASERRRRRVRRVMGRSCAGPFIRARTRPNRRGAHGFGRFFCSPPRRLRYAGRFCPLPPRAPIFGFERPQSAFSGGESRDIQEKRENANSGSDQTDQIDQTVGLGGAFAGAAFCRRAGSGGFRNAGQGESPLFPCL